MSEPEAARAVQATIPKNQKLVYRITPIGMGWMDAATLGKQLTAIANLLKAAANEDGPRMAVVLTNCRFLEGNVLEFEVAMLPYADHSVSRKPRRKRNHPNP